MNFESVREIVRSFDSKGFDGRLAAKSGVEIFSSGEPVLLRNNDVIVEVLHDGFCGVVGVSVYGNVAYLNGAGHSCLVDEMKKITSREPVSCFVNRGSSMQRGYVFRQNSRPFKSEIIGCMSNIQRLQKHMLEFMDEYVPDKTEGFVEARTFEKCDVTKREISGKLRKRYTMHTPNNGFHGRRDDHYRTIVEYGGEHMTVDSLICRLGNEKDGRSG